MSQQNKDNLLRASDCPVTPPAAYPGKFNRNNKNGTLVSRDDWKKVQAKIWFDEVKNLVKFKETTFANKAVTLKTWMNKTFKGISMKVVRTILIEIESELDKAGGIESDAESDEESDEDFMDIDEDPQNDSLDFFSQSDMEAEFFEKQHDGRKKKTAGGN